MSLCLHGREPDTLVSSSRRRPPGHDSYALPKAPAAALSTGDEMLVRGSAHHRVVQSGGDKGSLMKAKVRPLANAPAAPPQSLPG